MTGDFKKAEKVFVFSSEALAEFFAANFLDSVAILDETADAYLIEGKNGVRSLSKEHIESWLMGDRSVDRHTGSGDKNKDNNFVSEREKSLEQMRSDDKVLQDWYNQLGSTRLEFGMDSAEKAGNVRPDSGTYKGAEFYQQQQQE